MISFLLTHIHIFVAGVIDRISCRVRIPAPAPVAPYYDPHEHRVTSQPAPIGNDAEIIATIPPEGCTARWLSTALDRPVWRDLDRLVRAGRVRVNRGEKRHFYFAVRPS